MIRIVTDSTASISHEMACENDIEVATLFVNRDGVEYEDATMDLEEFYKDIQSMVDDIPTSSQPSQAQLEDIFEDVDVLIVMKFDISIEVSCEHP